MAIWCCMGQRGRETNMRADALQASALRTIDAQADGRQVVRCAQHQVEQPPVNVLPHAAAEHNRAATGGPGVGRPQEVVSRS